MPTTVRLQALSDLTRRPREAIRNAQKAGAAPWDEGEFEGASQRRYDGFHALALVLAETLMAQKVSMELAGETVRAHQQAINLFLDEVVEGATITSRFVLSLQQAVEDSLTGLRWMPILTLGYGTEEEVTEAIQNAIRSVGRVTETRNGTSSLRVIGGPSAAITSIPEAYRLLKQRAEAAGYLVDGRRIVKIADQAEGEEE